MMKEIAVLTLCAMMLCDPAMGSGLDAASEPALAGSMAGMVNPFTECGSLNEAGRRAGFEIQVMKMPEDWGKPVIRVSEERMIELIFRDAAHDREIRVRKAVGSGDISGDYGIFTEEQEIVTDGIPVTMKGNNEMISIAIWSDNGYAFSVSDSSGMSSGEMKQLVKNVR